MSSEAGPDEIRFTAEQAEGVVAEAARLYFEGCRARVDDFVDRHFSVAGALALHRKALGWDVLKVPANILLAIPNVALQLTALGAHATGARQTAAFLRSRRLLLETAVGREIEWLIMTELLELPYKVSGSRTRTRSLKRSCPLNRSKPPCRRSQTASASERMILNFGHGWRRL
jgi:hypothetical protein